jgi:hypothetical protein
MEGEDARSLIGTKRGRGRPPERGVAERHEQAAACLVLMKLAGVRATDARDLIAEVMPKSERRAWDALPDVVNEILNDSEGRNAPERWGPAPILPRGRRRGVAAAAVSPTKRSRSETGLGKNPRINDSAKSGLIPQPVLMFPRSSKRHERWLHGIFQSFGSRLLNGKSAHDIPRFTSGFTSRP